MAYRNESHSWDFGCHMLQQFLLGNMLECFIESVENSDMDSE